MGSKARWGIRTPSWILKLHADERGAVYVEYVSLTLLVAVLAAAALILVGAPLLESFQATRLILGAPVP